MLVIVTIKQSRICGIPAQKLQRMFGISISQKTLKRWLIYFKQVFPLSRLWRQIRGNIAVHLTSGKIPAAVLHFFIRQSETFQTGLIRSALFFSGGMQMAF